MQGAWSVVKQRVIEYAGGSSVVLLFVISLVYILVRSKRKRWSIACPVIVMVVAMVNPVSYLVLQKLMKNDIYSYWRLFWMIPIIPVIAYAATLAIRNSRNVLIKIGIFAVVVCTLLFNGEYMYGTYGSTIFAKAENQYKIPQETIDVSDAVLNLGENLRVIMPSSLYCYVPQYTTKIHMLYGRNADGFIYFEYWVYVLRNKITDGDPAACDLARARGCDVIVLEKGQLVDDRQFELRGFYYCTTIEGYRIYQYKD